MLGDFLSNCSQNNVKLYRKVFVATPLYINSTHVLWHACYEQMYIFERI